MVTRDTAALLQAKTDLPWKPPLDGQTKARWILLLEYASTQVGLSESGTWLIGTSHGVSEAVSSPIVVGLPLLALSRADVLQRLKEALRDLGLPEALTDAFPFESIIQTALEGRLSHWAQLALTWIQGTTITTVLREDLEALISARWADQETRQAAARLLRDHRCPSSP